MGDSESPVQPEKERTMDGKTVAIGVLVICAVLLGGVVVSGLRQDAYAQGGVYATYLAVTANAQENNATFFILDTESRGMLPYKVDQGTGVLSPGTAGFILTQEFKHTGP
jgi:hypothetical protein